MSIIDLRLEDNTSIQAATRLLYEVFAEENPSWRTIEDALEEVNDILTEGGIIRMALDENGRILGWIGGLEQYNGNVWELHPLAVRQDKQRQGIGSALVRDFEEQAAKQGVVTVTLGTDDTNGKTTLSGKNLYPDVWIHIKEIQNLGDHPYEFYQKLGYTITGVIPDANGPGKPDILMSKRI
jgi:aminoglycoside 6'-N-acetyltransferase I